MLKMTLAERKQRKSKFSLVLIGVFWPWNGLFINNWE